MLLKDDTCPKREKRKKLNDGKKQCLSEAITEYYSK